MISEWIICPICGNKTRDRVMEDSRHACGLVLDNGMELLLHIGIDTVEMQGDGFEKGNIGKNQQRCLPV